MFDVDLNTYRLREDDIEEVIDPFYIDQIECMPVPKIDWGWREEDDLFSHTKEVLTKTKNLLKSKSVESITPNSLGKYSKAKSKKAFQKQKATTNPDVHGPIAGSVEVEVEAAPQSLQLQIQEEAPKVKWVTRSSMKKTLSNKSKDTVIANLDPTEAKFDSE